MRSPTIMNTMSVNPIPVLEKDQRIDSEGMELDIALKDMRNMSA